MRNMHRPTERVIDILEYVSSGSRGFTLTEIAKHINAPKSSILPIIRTLKDRGYLSLREDNNRYHMGVKTLEVGYSYLRNNGLIENIHEKMEHIVKSCGETCYFGQLNGGEVLYILKVDSPESIRMVASVGQRLPAYTTAIGKALLADMSLEDIKKLYPNGLKPITNNTIVDFCQLYNQLLEIRNGSPAWEIEESQPMIRCIAVPIRKNNRVIASLSVAIPIFRYSDEKLDLAQSLLKNAKEEIEYLLAMTDIDSFTSDMRLNV